MEFSDLIKQLNARKAGKGYRAKCPAHNDKSPSLWFTCDNGSLYFECKAGCEYTAVRAALGLEGGLRAEGAPVEIRDPVIEANRRRKIHEAWDRSIPITEGTPAWSYLRNRKCIDQGEYIPAVLRQTSVEIPYYNDEGSETGKYFAMLAKLQEPDGAIATLHRTFLTPDGFKAKVEKPKKLMVSPFAGCTDGGAIRLHAPIENTLGIAEGIETALACNKLFGCPMWAAWSASGMQKIQLPKEVRTLLIFADNDTSGLKAANNLMIRLQTENVNLKAYLHIPKLKGSDWHDQWISNSGSTGVQVSRNDSQAGT